MAFVKHYSRESFGRRYRAYRISFYIYLCVFAAAFAAGIISGRASPNGGSPAAFGGGISAKLVFYSAWILLSKKVLVYLGVFALGVTVWAPPAGAFGAAVLGFFAGGDLSLMISGQSGLPAECVWCVSVLLEAAVYLMYAAFACAVSLRLYSDKLFMAGDNVDEEGRCFGGLLFNSVMYRNTVNLRFLFSYTAALLIAVAAAYIIYLPTALALLVIL